MHKVFWFFWVWSSLLMWGLVIPQAGASAMFGGTALPWADILTPDSPSAYEGMRYTGLQKRTVFDRRVNKFVSQKMHTFQVRFTDDVRLDFQVNPEFIDLTDVKRDVETWSYMIGQLPHVLRVQVKTVWFHDGDHLFGGGNQNILIHKQQGLAYIQDGIAEEILFHEATHTALNWPKSAGVDHGQTAGWRAAQVADEGFISEYAAAHPDREDVPESFLPWFALRYKPHVLYRLHRNWITRSIPNRLRYFDQQNFNLFPAE